MGSVSWSAPVASRGEDSYQVAGVGHALSYPKCLKPRPLWVRRRVLARFQLSRPGGGPGAPHHAHMRYIRVPSLLCTNL